MSDVGDQHDRDGERDWPTLDRRKFLLGSVAGVGGLLGLGGTGAAAAPATARRRPSHRAKPAVVQKKLESGVIVPTAPWLIAENAKPGTTDWVVTGIQTPHAIEGYASHVSAVAGEEVTLFINSTSKSVGMQAFRMGYYKGLGGRLIYQSDDVAAQRQAPPSVAAGVSTVSCQWEPSIRFTVGRTWPPGNYLLKIQGDGGQQQYIPLTVRDDTSTAAYVIQNSVTTWQAYNLWGDYSLYYGATPTGRSDFDHRARIVSFDRPYPQTWAQGAADFFGNEFPLLYQMERLGLDLTYWTDVDLHQRPQLLANHHCLFSLGHDEYWSLPMRTGAEQALASGTNLAFLGANACYRQIRFQPSAVGVDRQMICYKDATEDPMAKVDPTQVTVNWEQEPVNRPESQFMGSMYQSVGALDPLVVTDSSSWLYDGCNLTDGHQLPLVVKGEFDRYVPHFPGPTNVDVLAHSPVAGTGNWSDITYYTGTGGGGVLTSGSASFIVNLSDTTGFPWNIVPKAIPGVTDILLRAMENVYGAFGHGPAATTAHPSAGNWTEVYVGSSAQAGSAAANNTA